MTFFVVGAKHWMFSKEIIPGALEILGQFYIPILCDLSFSNLSKMA